MNHEKIKKVHVVYKTHLDIGFTDMGQNVLDKYTNEYIPKSVKLALKLNKPDDKKFVWTLGSYLIDYYFKNADPEHRGELKEAIENGYICWHQLPFTTYTELLDEELFRYGISIGQKLDQRFQKNTIAAKMTDVPGHTIAIVKPMAEAGIRFLHIGVNASSKVPEVPETFIWKNGDQEIIVQYSSQYGMPGYVEGMEEVLEFAHTGDNLGPQTEEEIIAEMNRIQEIYPNAKVEASTLDAYAKALLQYKDKLPVVEEEIGDTWIHGTATDPWKVTRYKELIRLKNQWKEKGLLSEKLPWYEEFMMNLLLVAEHTWGMDFKKYLADFKNWEKKDFQSARKTDVTTLEEHLTNRNAHMLKILKEDLIKYRNGTFTGSYKVYESSCMEQRTYLEKAIGALPEDLKREAMDALSELCLVCNEETDERIQAGKFISIGNWRIKIAQTGAVGYLKYREKEWIVDGEAGRFQYEIYDAQTCMENYHHYNRDFYETCGWAEPDFSKPGLEFVETLKRKCFDFYITWMHRKDNVITVALKADEEAAEAYGAPREVTIQYSFEEDGLRCKLDWKRKDANKIPEALWFGFQFDVENPMRWTMKKMNTIVSPLNVVRGGNRQQHCVEEMMYEGADGCVYVKSLHAPLVSMGGRNLYTDYENIPDMGNGFCFNLFNNRWGTDFPMWCEDDGFFEFRITFQNH